MKKLLVSVFLFPISLVACSKPVVDCSEFPAIESSPYALPYEVGTVRNVYASTEHYRASNKGVGTFAIDFINILSFGFNSFTKLSFWK